MRHLIYFFAICVLTFSIIGNVNAQVPQTISYQGLLTTSSGAPIADGNYNLTFSLYTVPTGGTPIWTETQSSVPVSNGTFSVILGSITPFTGVNFAQQLYLGITKDSDPEFSPRSALTSAPSSLAPWGISGSDISYMSGKVGIGTVTPNEQLEITGNLRLPVSTASVGIIKSGENRFIHNYGTDNFFAGVNAGNLTMTGFGCNTGVGVRALFSNTTGYWNTANGYHALYSNTAGNYNTANGVGALYSNTTGFDNTANGYGALLFNTTGSNNTANGVGALYSNTTGNYNTANGYGALLFNNSGNYNTALGYSAGSNITSGSNNIAIGYNAQVPTATASNQIRLGNTSITYAGIQVAWTVTSDRRYKDNIQPLNLGLGFISKLNPVSYYRKADEKQRTEYGLIAQEVEQVLKECGVEKPGMLTITDEGMYELRYNDLLAPMIKAIQELKEKNEKLTSRLNELEMIVKLLFEQNQKEGVKYSAD